MKLDSEEQRRLLLQLIDMSQFPGSARKAIYELGDAVEKATIGPEQDIRELNMPLRSDP